MKLLVRSFGVACALLMFAGVHDASAQITGPVEFTTAFPFTVGNATVPAGSYTITPDVDNPSILQLSGVRTSVLFEANSAQARETPSKTEVVFKRYGDGYVLKDIWMEGESTGAESMTAEAERHVMKHVGRAAEERVAGRRKPHSSK